MENMTKVKNGYIELCRFLFCMMIVLHHFEVDADTGSLLPSGYLAVEFFFFLSGCFLMRHISAEKREIPEKMRYAVGYTLEKLKRVFPYAACGILLCHIWRAFCTRNTPLEMIRGLVNLPYELLFLPMTGVISVGPDRYLNQPLWYLSAMLITLPLVMYLGLKIPDVFRSYMVWILPLMIHGWMIMHLGSAGSWGGVTFLGYSGILRAFADLLMGCGIYLAAECLKKRKVKAAGKLLLTAVEILFLLGCFALAVPSPEPYNFEVAAGMLAVFLTITVSGVSYTSLVKGKFFEWLGKLSLPVYCVHSGVMPIVQEYAGDYPYPAKLGLILGISILLSVIMVYGIEKGRNRKKRGNSNADI